MWVAAAHRTEGSTMKKNETVKINGIIIEKIDTASRWDFVIGNPQYEIYVPEGFEFGGCHSLLATVIAAARIDANDIANARDRGELTRCTGEQGCEPCRA